MQVKKRRYKKIIKRADCLFTTDKIRIVHYVAYARLYLHTYMVPYKRLIGLIGKCEINLNTCIHNSPT